MSELSAKIRTLRGNLSGEEAGEKANLSRETFYRIERGGSVKFETLKQIAKAFKLSEADWASIVIAWMRDCAQDAADLLIIEPRNLEPSALNDKDGNEVAQAMMLFQRLSHDDRSQITRAMQRKEVLASIAAINKVWETFDRQHKAKA